MQFNPARWFEKKSTYDLSDPRLIEIFGAGSTLSGVAVGPSSALHVPAVNAAVRVIAESVASLPVNILKDDGTAKTVDKKHALYRVLHYEPNGWTSSYEFRLQMQVDVLLHGNAYAFVNRVGGTVREIIRLHPTSVAVKIDIDSGEPTYEIRNTSGGTRTCSFADIIHVKALSTDGTLGIAPIQHAREAIALALSLEGHAAKLMGNAGRPSGVLKFKGAKLTAIQLDRIKAQWRDSHSGGASGGTAIFDSDTEFSPLTFNSVDMQFVELRRFQLDEISRAFRVPPHLLSELGRATWSNTTDMGQAFLDYTLMPWILNWTGALSRALLTPEERTDSTIEFDTSALTRANLQVRTDSYSKAVGGPWLTADEARALENRPPIAGGDVLNEPMGAAPTEAKANPNHDDRGRFAAAAGVAAHAALGAAIGGPVGAVEGAVLGVLIESGAAAAIGRAVLNTFGWAILPHPLAARATVGIYSKSELPPCTPENVDRFLTTLTPDEIKQMTRTIVASMSAADQKTILALVAANDNEPKKDELAA